MPPSLSKVYALRCTIDTQFNHLYTKLMLFTLNRLRLSLATVATIESSR